MPRDNKGSHSRGSRLISLTAWAVLGGLLGVQIGTNEGRAQQSAGDVVASPTPPGSSAYPLHEAWRGPIEAVAARRAPDGPPWPVAEYSTRRPSDGSLWVEGYWDYDPAVERYVWVPGTWRVPPPGRTWIDGYWTQDDQGWYRVAGFWTSNPASAYLRQGPPEGRPEQEKGPRPSKLHLWIPGHYAPNGNSVAWKPGFWSKHQKGWTWIPAAWLERPEGWVYQAGYWLRDADLLAARDRARGGRTVAGLVRPTPSRLGGPITDAEALLRAWASERSLAPRAPIDPDDIRLRPPPGYIPGAGSTVSRFDRLYPGGRAGGDASAAGAPDWTARNPAVTPYEATQPWHADPYGGRGNAASNRYTGPSTGVVPDTTPRPAYYVGNNAPGTTYNSYSQTPAGWPSRSTYVGSASPGTSYGSYSLTPSGTPGSSRYVGHSSPGTSYRSYSTGSVGSIGNYGYGTTAPGNTAGQIGLPAR